MSYFKLIHVPSLASHSLPLATQPVTFSNPDITNKPMSELFKFILDNEDAFKNPARLASLYADFASQKSSNPDGYQANISAWRNALFKASRAGLLPGADGRNSLLSMCAGEKLSKSLQSTAFGRPLALGCVIDEAVAKNDMMPSKEFLEAKTSIYHKPWMQLPAPWRSAQWILRQFGLIGSGNSLPGGSFVLVANVEEAARRVLLEVSKRSTNPSDMVFSHSTFAHYFSHILSPNCSLSQTDMTILLTHLARDHHALSFTSTAIKFVPPNSMSTQLTISPPPITQNDTSIAQLQTLILTLNTQISALESRISALDTTARAAIANGLTNTTPNCRMTAISALRSKKLAQSTLDRRISSLSQVEDVLAKIDEAAGQVEMVRAMEASASVLKMLNKEVGGVERVDKVMEELREESGKVDEMQGVLNEGVSGDGGVLLDDGELDEEVEALEKEERERRLEDERRRKMEELPSPITTEPVKDTAAVVIIGSENVDEALAKSVEGLKEMSIGDKRNAKERAAAS